MGNGFTIKVAGLPKVKRFLKAKKVNTDEKVKIGIVRATIFVQGEVKDSIAGRKAETKSVDTGRFLNSVGTEFSNTEGEVFSHLPYAKKLEYGTDFKNSPRKHFRNSLDRSKPKIKDIIQQSINKI